MLQLLCYLGFQLNKRAIPTLGMDILRGKTPEMVRKEIYAHLLAYNLLRTLMWEAGTTYKVDPLLIICSTVTEIMSSILPMSCRDVSV